MQTFFDRIAWVRAQQYIAKHQSFRIVVAGTYGRTLVSHMAYHAMREHRHVRLGYPVQDAADIPLSILGTTHEKAHTNMIAFLVGAKKRELYEREPDTIIAELPLLTSGFAPKATKKILPQMLVLHYVGSEHLDVFSTTQNTSHEYEQICLSLPGDARIAINIDSTNAIAAAQHAHAQRITYGRSLAADICLTRAVRGDSATGIFVEITVEGRRYEAFLPNLFAKEHVSSLLAAVACAYMRNINPAHALQAIKHMPLPHGALQKVEARGATILTEHVECPEQMIESLKTLGSLPSSGRKIAVLGDVDSLGAQTIALHKQIGEQASQVASLIIFVGDAMRSAQRAAIVLEQKADTHHFATAQEAATWIAQHIQHNDMLYIAGGAIMNMERIVERLLAKE